jgi:hypothetical protein
MSIVQAGLQVEIAKTVDGLERCGCSPPTGHSCSAGLAWTLSVSLRGKRPEDDLRGPTFKSRSRSRSRSMGQKEEERKIEIEEIPIGRCCGRKTPACFNSNRARAQRYSVQYEGYGVMYSTVLGTVNSVVTTHGKSSSQTGTTVITALFLRIISFSFLLFLLHLVRVTCISLCGCFFLALLTVLLRPTGCIHTRSTHSLVARWYGWIHATSNIQ